MSYFRESLQMLLNSISKDLLSRLFINVLCSNTGKNRVFAVKIFTLKCAARSLNLVPSHIVHVNAIKEAASFHV